MFGRLKMRWCITSAIWAAAFSLLLLLQSINGQEAGTLMPPGEGASINMMQNTFCSGPLDVIREGILNLWDPAEFTAVINCLAFGREGALETGIVSAFPNDGTPGTRFVVSCREDTLLVTTSAQPARQFNITAREFQACAECVDGPNVLNICPEARRCPVECERCFEFSPTVLTCTECVGFRLLNQYQPGTLVTAEQIETERQRLEASGQEEVCLNNPIPDPNLGTSFTCVEECPGGSNSSEPNPDGTCYACGIEYCVQCEPSEGGVSEGGVSEGECLVCLSGTVLFEGRCYSCPLALIARTAILQEAEEQEEIQIQNQRRIELAISLPIVSTLVTVFFILMSVFAHCRYPHHGFHDDKKHRNKHDPFADATVPFPDSHGPHGAPSMPHFP